MAKVVHDMFYWLGQINKASMVMHARDGILTSEQAVRFAKGLERVLDKGNQEGAARPGLYITFEPLMIKEATDEITLIHAGRSSQDMLATCRFAILRENILALAEAITKTEELLLEKAAQHQGTIMPSYTNGVAAQPNSYGHYLLAVAEGFARDSERLRQYYVRLNRCPMGTTVLNGTSWPLDRDKMADYLGFDAISYNAFDANQIYSFEYGVEAGYLVTSLALRIGNFIEDVMQQYAQPRPWIILQEGGANTFVSSAMPQKRNPGILNKTRAAASTLLGSAVGAVFRSHNIPAGMPDARSTELNKMVQDGKAMVDNFSKILQALVINPERALEELNLDWTASQEVADVLMRKYKIPFRIGHHVASEIVSYARKNGFTPMSFPYEQVQRIYKEVVAGHEHVPAELPMSPAEFKATLDPVAIVNNRATKGGPQPVEMAKMLIDYRGRWMEECVWCREKKQKIAGAENTLNDAFAKLLK